MEVNRPAVSFDLDAVERIVAFRNVKATNNRKSDAQISDLVLHSRFSSIDTILSKPKLEDNLDALHAKTRDGDLVIALGGDGLANTLLQYAGSMAGNQIAVMFSESGSTNNGLRATTVEAEALTPSERLLKGHLANVIPLRATVIAGSETEQRLAWNIISVGAIATGAQIINQPEHRSSYWWQHEQTRMAYKLYLSFMKALPAAHTLRVIETTSPKARPLLDRFIARGPRVADLIDLPSELTDTAYITGEIPDKLPWHILPAVGRLLTGSFPFERIEDHSSPVGFRLSRSRHNRHALIQYDGEPVPLVPGSIVRLDQPRVDDPKFRAVPVLTTRQVAA